MRLQMQERLRVGGKWVDGGGGGGGLGVSNQLNHSPCPCKSQHESLSLIYDLCESH
jgi:hypothetical protein